MTPSSPAVGSVLVDVLLGFPHAPEPWWQGGTVAPALFATMRAHGLWSGFDHAGLAGGELAPMDDDALAAWSAGWSARKRYRLAGAAGGPTRLELSPAQGLRLLYRVSADEVAARAAVLLDEVVGWLRAIRASDVGGGVRIRRAGVLPDADFTPPPPAPALRAWDTGTVLDAIDREVYAEEIAAQYWNDRTATREEGEAELARLLAAPAPPGSVRLDDGPLVVWKHVADLTDAAAVERARLAQWQWVSGVAEAANE